MSVATAVAINARARITDRISVRHEPVNHAPAADAPAVAVPEGAAEARAAPALKAPPPDGSSGDLTSDGAWDASGRTDAVASPDEPATTVRGTPVRARCVGGGGAAEGEREGERDKSEAEPGQGGLPGTVLDGVIASVDLPGD